MDERGKRRGLSYGIHADNCLEVTLGQPSLNPRLLFINDCSDINLDFDRQRCCNLTSAGKQAKHTVTQGLFDSSLSHPSSVRHDSGNGGCSRTSELLLNISPY